MSVLAVTTADLEWYLGLGLPDAKKKIAELKREGRIVVVPEEKTRGGRS